MTFIGNGKTRLVAREMQMHVPQDYASVVETEMLMGVTKMIVASQSNRPIMGVIQDALVGCYLMSYPNVNVPRHQFMDCVFSAGEKYVSALPNLFSRASKYYSNLFNGRVLFSVLLPADFHYSVNNGISKEEPIVNIKDGILLSGIIDKKVIGKTHGSIIHRLYKEYSPEHAAEFLSSVQFLANRWIGYRGFSIGISDFKISEENHTGVQTAIQKAYIEVQTIEESTDSEMLKEFKINNALNNRGQSLAINGLCANNQLEVMINSGSKGSRMNIIQITGHLGQNNVEGRRIMPEIDNGERTLPCFRRGDKHPKTKGFIENSFMDGLTPSSFFQHAKAGREGCINTAVKTKESGYAERKLVKRMEDMTVAQDGTVRNSVNNIVDFSYGEAMDPTWMYNNNGPSFIDIDNLVSALNSEEPSVPQPEAVLENVRNKFHKEELTASIKEYTETVARLKKMKQPAMLKLASAKLKQLEEMLHT